jgi:hypothetical protein
MSIHMSLCESSCEGSEAQSREWRDLSSFCGLLMISTCALIVPAHTCLSTCMKACCASIRDQAHAEQVDPSLKKADWTPEEDKRIVAAQSRIGSRFAQIAKFLEGRSVLPSPWRSLDLCFATVKVGTRTTLQQRTGVATIRVSWSLKRNQGFTLCECILTLCVCVCVSRRSETHVNHRWNKVLKVKAEQMLAEMTDADFDFLNVSTSVFNLVNISVCFCVVVRFSEDTKYGRILSSTLAPSSVLTCILCLTTLLFHACAHTNKITTIKTYTTQQRRNPNITY